MINGAYLHLVVNHIPVVGFPICFLVLLAGRLRKSRELLQVGLVGVVLIALLTGIAWKSGGAAAHVLTHYPGVTVTKEQIHPHAEAGEDGAVMAGVLGALAILSGWFVRRSEDAPKALVGFMILGTFAISLWMGYVAHLGGLIRHPEIAMIRPPAQ